MPRTTTDPSDEDIDVEASHALLPTSPSHSQWPREKPSVSEKRGLRYRRAWEVWAIGFICLVSGIAIGALLGARGKSCVASAGSGSGGGALAEAEAEVGGVDRAPFGYNISVIFSPNADFQKDGGPEADGIWDSLLPRGKGFIQLSTTGTPIPYADQDSTNSLLENTKVVSVFHQLHCLNNIRKSLLAATSPESDPSTLSDPTHSSSSSSSSSSHSPSTFQYLAPHLKTHWHHCFDYLRQSLMCNADVTLETLERSKVDGRILRSVDGWGTKHVCRDFGRLWEWAQEARAGVGGGL
ncbi:uncharacterized protein EI97DRAFT_465165 [Westerdykella ornata]|uniref:Uncharacterized protein n=1 Tax=Westerdykella ornata TaxID=318751 RepID=A0A6A6JQU3_WESOR|nr:uncharacterized protein EI97DRAFT_465165 [Westerdykella ornata]KAF2278757.1 hypothetical protein EI97DRAFT_465165 [Westerdykella ornata]